MIRFIDLQDELAKANELLSSAGLKGRMKITDCPYVKYCKTIKQVEELSLANDITPLLALNQWHTYCCNKALLEIFIDFGCGQKSENTFVFNDIEYTTTFLMNHNSENSSILGSRTGKNEYLSKKYKEDSERGFKGQRNSIYVMVNAKDVNEYRERKINFEEIAKKIMQFIAYYSQHELNTIDFEGNKIYADVIVV